jgi:hypothetical protein
MVRENRSGENEESMESSFRFIASIATMNLWLRFGFVAEIACVGFAGCNETTFVSVTGGKSAILLANPNILGASERNSLQRNAFFCLSFVADVATKISDLSDNLPLARGTWSGDSRTLPAEDGRFCIWR